MLVLLFQDRSKRDAKALELDRQGLLVKKSTVSGQQLHPQYVEDFEGPEKLDTGFGNTVYKTYFPKLYKLEEVV